MGFMVRDIEFPITDGLVIAALKAGLISWAPLTVQRKFVKVRRLITVRNDSGPQQDSLSRRRYGINVWADSSTDAENLALDAMRVLRQLPSGVIKGADEFSGPYEIEDEVQYEVGGANLTHFYFTFRIHVKGSKP